MAVRTEAYAEYSVVYSESLLSKVRRRHDAEEDSSGPLVVVKG